MHRWKRGTKGVKGDHWVAKLTKPIVLLRASTINRIVGIALLSTTGTRTIKMAKRWKIRGRVYQSIPSDV